MLTHSAQEQKGLTLDQVVMLIQNHVPTNRILQHLEDRGVAFELDEHALRRLKEARAPEEVISAVKRKGALYTTEEQRKRQQADARRREAEQRRVAEEAKRRKDREKTIVEEARRQEEEKGRLEETRITEAAKREKEKAAKRQIEETRGEKQSRNNLDEEKKLPKEATERSEAIHSMPSAQPAADIAPAPPCFVGLRLRFQLDDGRAFFRRFSAGEAGHCVVSVGTSSYYYQDWVLIKIVSADGKAITQPSLMYPFIGQKWLDFPLRVGKKWEQRWRAKRSQNIINYYNIFTVVAIEEMTVRAGTYRAFKIKQQQHNERSWGVRYFWYAPAVGYYIKRRRSPVESTDPNYWSTVRDFELVSVFAIK